MKFDYSVHNMGKREEMVLQYSNIFLNEHNFEDEREVVVSLVISTT